MIPFKNPIYANMNKVRLDHLASLGLPLEDKTVLEVGAGIGDLSEFFCEDRNCKLTITEARKENLIQIYDLLEDHPNVVKIDKLDMEKVEGVDYGQYEIVFCYGLLYHLRNPAQAIDFMARSCDDLFLLETQVSPGHQERINIVKENAVVASNAISGVGCRPTRPWVFNELKKHFEYVYMPVTQPRHPWYPQSWLGEPRPARSVFVASRTEIDSDLLVASVPSKQKWMDKVE